MSTKLQETGLADSTLFALSTTPTDKQYLITMPEFGGKWERRVTLGYLCLPCWVRDTA